MQAAIQKWRNSLGLRIPSLWAKDNNVSNGSKVELVVEHNKIVFLPKKKTLDDLLAMVTEENTHPETAINGCILSNQVENLDWRQRNCQLIEKATKEELATAVGNIRLLME